MFGSELFAGSQFGGTEVFSILINVTEPIVTVFEGDTVVDQTVLTESLTITAPLAGISIFDSTTTSENLNFAPNNPASVFDSATVTDFPGFYPDLVITTEFLTLVEILHSFISVFDSVTTSESTVVDLPEKQSVNDTVTTSENVQVSAPLPGISVFDSTVTAEFIGFTFVSLVIVFDTVSALDVISQQETVQPSVFDATTTSESSNVVLGQHILVLEIPVVTSESLSIRFPIEEGNLIQIDTTDS